MASVPPSTAALSSSPLSPRSAMSPPRRRGETPIQESKASAPPLKATPLTETATPPMAAMKTSPNAADTIVFQPNSVSSGEIAGAAATSPALFATRQKTSTSSTSGQLNGTLVSRSSRGGGDSLVYSDDSATGTSGIDREGDAASGNVSEDEVHSVGPDGLRCDLQLTTRFAVTPMHETEPTHQEGEEVVEDNTIKRHPSFSSLLSSTTSWAAMRRRQREMTEQASLGSQAKAYVGTNCLRNGGGVPESRAAVLAASHGSPSAAVPVNTAATQHSSTAGHWVLAPRLCGVNEILLATDNAHIFREVLDAMQVWNTELSLDLHHNSAGGTYVVRQAPSSASCTAASPSKEVLGIFKPRDEEIGQESNPHGNRESDRTEAFAPGSGSRREVLAYRLDHGHNAGIPATIEVVSGHGAAQIPPHRQQQRHFESSAPLAGASLSSPASAARAPLSNGNTGATPNSMHRYVDPPCAAGSHPTTVSTAVTDNELLSSGASSLPQIGSLQRFVPGCQEAADVLPGKFMLDEVHALAIFDIRTLNGDRHGGNVLVEGYQRTALHRASPTEADENAGTATAPPHLIPIDHSYICPSGYADPDYEWLSWPQSKRPFSLHSLDYIRALDADADAAIVRAALLAHSGSLTESLCRNVCPVPDAASLPHGEEGWKSKPDSSDALEDGPLHYCSSCFPRGGGPTGGCTGEETMCCFLDDGVRRARAVVQECGIDLNLTVSPYAVSHESLRDWQTHLYTAAAASMSTAQASFHDLTVFSPVRTVKSRGANGKKGAAPAMTGGEDGSDGAFSAAATPMQNTTTAIWDTNDEQQVKSKVDIWEEATAQLLLAQTRNTGHDSNKCGDGDTDALSAEDALCGKSHVAASPSEHTPSSSTLPSLSFAVYGDMSDQPTDTEGAGSMTGVAATYDADAANAAAELLRCTTRLLQIAALEFHLTAYDIGSLCRRPRVAQASFLEEVMEEARDELTWSLVMSKFDTLVRRRLRKRARGLSS